MNLFTYRIEGVGKKKFFFVVLLSFGSGSIWHVDKATWS